MYTKDFYYDFLPENNLEKDYFLEIAYWLHNKTPQIVSINYGDDHLLDKTLGPVIVLMNADEQYRIPKCVDNPNVVMIFKQYTLPNQHEKLRPIPIGTKCGFNPKVKPFAERKFQFSFIGQSGNDQRRGAINVMLDIANRYNAFVGLTSGFNTGIKVEHYAEIMADSLIAIVPPGTASVESFRFCEGIRAGCVVFCPKMPDTWFYQNDFYVEYEGNFHLQQLLEYHLSDRHIFNDTTFNNIQHYQKEYLSPKAVSEYILEEMLKL